MKTMTLHDAIVTALNVTLISKVIADERHLIGERENRYVPEDDPELIDYVSDAVVRCSGIVRSAVDSVFENGI